jgi:NAD(P) transhydrogenase subunit beta
MISNDLYDFSYLLSAVFFILSLKSLSSAYTAKKGIVFGICGMVLSVITTVLSFSSLDLINPLFVVIISGSLIGYIVSKKINMTALPQLVAAFHSLVGLGAVLVSFSSFCSPELFGICGDSSQIPSLNLIEMSLGLSIGSVTFTGSSVAFGKLQGIIPGKPIIFKNQHKLNLLIAVAILGGIVFFLKDSSLFCLLIILCLSLALGILIIVPVGGADMPVIVSMLNSYSGWAASGIGFTIGNTLLIITGALVGASGAILSYIMCKGMNRSLSKIVFGGISGSDSVPGSSSGNAGNVKLCSPEDAGFVIENASSVIIIPGYGMAVSQAQHALKELADVLKSSEINVRYAIHPVAGRMPGHMNVLLAEANIPYEDVFEIDEINHDFVNTDVSIVVGANDITNPAAKNDPSSPIYGMPILDVEKSKNVLFIKRSLGSGYAGIENQLFYRSNTMMILGDAKKVCEGILKSLMPS